MERELLSLLWALLRRRRVDINYAVLLPPPKRSAKKLQMAILGGVGFVALTAIVVAIVLVKAYAPQAAPLGPQVPTPSLTAATMPALAPTLLATPDPKTAPSAVDKDNGDKATKGKKKGGRNVRRGKPGAVAPAAPAGAPKPKKKADDELKKLLGI
jgi:hypothetical protein